MESQAQNEVLWDFSQRLEKLQIKYMLTGSMALVHYAMPRTTVDIDIIIELSAVELTKFIKEFENDYYIPQNRAYDSVIHKRMFNVINQKSVIKIDCVIRKDDEFSLEAFARRKRIKYTKDFEIWVTSKEDLILAKLNWAKNSRSEMQMKDIASLIRNEYDIDFVETWAKKLGVKELLEDCRKLLEQNDAD